MNKMKRISLAFCLVFASAVLAQQPAAPTPPAAPAAKPEVTVKSTPAFDVLVSTAKSVSADQAALDIKIKQFNAQQSTVTKPLQDELAAEGKALNEKVGKDKKYKKDFAQIADTSKKLQEAQQGAN